MDDYKAVTSGEHLFQYIYSELRDERTWSKISNTIRPLGHNENLAEYYQHHAALSLTCKIIASGKSVTKMEEENSSLLDSIINGFPWNRLNNSGRLSRHLVKAVQNSGRVISAGVRKDVLAFAKSKHPYCYICGKSLQFSNDADDDYYTAEHLWPSSYGGDSSEENLLPACRYCNNKKGNSVTWVSTDVHSLFLGIDPSRESLSKIGFQRRYAIYNLAGINEARRQKCTLKEAFLRIKPWIDVYVADTTLPSDMFNLQTTNPFY